MSSKKSLWYRLGYAFERTRQVPSDGSRKLATLKERATGRRGKKGSPSKRSSDTLVPDLNELLTTGGVALAAKALERWRPRKSTGFTSILKAGAAGAAAALLVELVRPLLSGEARLGPIDEDTPDRLLRGAVQGVLYGSVVEPLVPGPALIKGAVYGGGEYLTEGMGGLVHFLGTRSALGRVPMLGGLLAEMDEEERGLFEGMVFAAALALLYEER